MSYKQSSSIYSHEIVFITKFQAIKLSFSILSVSPTGAAPQQGVAGRLPCQKGLRPARRPVCRPGSQSANKINFIKCKLMALWLTELR